jgi:hypothetical protein
MNHRHTGLMLYSTNAKTPISPPCGFAVTQWNGAVTVDDGFVLVLSLNYQFNLPPIRL